MKYKQIKQIEFSDGIVSRSAVCMYVLYIFLVCIQYMYVCNMYVCTGVFLPCDGRPRRVHRYRGQDLRDRVHPEAPGEGHGDRHGQVRVAHRSSHTHVTYIHTYNVTVCPLVQV